MKNKNTIWILIPGVLIIWGVLIYQVFDTLSSDDIKNPTISQTEFRPKKLSKQDTFELKSIDSDPFLGTVYQRQPLPKSQRKKKTTRVVWPEIAYKGIIADGDRFSEIFILDINGRQHILKKKDTVLGVRLLSGTTDKITLRFKGQLRKFDKV